MYLEYKLSIAYTDTQSATYIKGTKPWLLNIGVKFPNRKSMAKTKAPVIKIESKIRDIIIDFLSLIIETNLFIRIPKCIKNFDRIPKVEE